MSESFQEFCKRILPAVQAGSEGKKIDSFGEVSGEWSGKDSSTFFASCKYHIAEPEATPLPITPEMWAMIDEKYKYAFLSHAGQKVVCEKEPKWDDGKGGLPADWIVYGYCSKLPLNIDTTGIIPELSLTKRPEPPEFTVNVDRLKVAAEMLKEIDGVKTTANTPTEEEVRPKNFCSSCGSEVNFGMRMRNMYQESLMSSPEKVEEKSELDKLKSQATHYMSKIGGKIYFRRFEGDWQLLHEPSKLWLSVYLVDESKLIEIK